MTHRMQYIWITGAGSGIGEQLALLLAERGHTVIISGRDAGRLEAVAAKTPDRIHALVFDVTDRSASALTTQQLQALAPWLDCVVLNAGTCEYVDPPDLDMAMFERVMATNFFGLINSFNTALPLLRVAPSRPHLAGVASMASYVGFPRAEAYGSSKAAAVYLLNSLRADFGSWLDVTVINPGFVATPMTSTNDFPMPFLISSEEAARTIADRLPARPLTLSFPRRLHWTLRVAQLFPALWYRRIVPGMTRKQA